MKKTIFVMLLLLLSFGLLACQPVAETSDEEDDGQEEVEATATAAPPVEASSTPTPGAYPSQPTPTPVGSDGYPAPADAAPLPTGYPADLKIWVLQPLGTQCEGEENHAYTSLQEAITGLEVSAVTVFDSETVELAVCESCNCPTSTHFRAQILRGDLMAARQLNWVEESDGQ